MRYVATASTSTHDRINSSTTDIGLTAATPALVLVEDKTRGDYEEALAWQAFQSVTMEP